MGLSELKFLHIAEAIHCIDQKVNLIGVVVESGLPKSTKGTDFFCSVRIVDESLPTGIQISFYAETMEGLPLIENVGDILVVSRVMIKPRGNDVYALFNKRFSSFALFEGRSSSIESFIAYQISAFYKPRYQEKNIIMQLRKWSIPANIEGFHEIMLIRDMKAEENINMLCKILHVTQVRENQWMMFIWDGTDAPPASLEENLVDEMRNPLPLALEPSPLSRELLCTFPTVGTVLRVIIDQETVQLGIKFLKTNRWTKFINLRCEESYALWHAVLTPYTKFCYFRDDNVTVRRFERFHERRYVSKWNRAPYTAFPPSRITETTHPDVGLVTLMDILTYEEVTFKYKTVVRIVAMFPWRADNFRSSITGIYRVRVTLEDPTARIHAYLYQEDAEKFFEQCQTVDELTKVRNALLGIADEDGGPNAVRNPPWIWCCLKSYYNDKSDPWGTRNYRIFDTTCILSEC